MHGFVLVEFRVCDIYKGVAVCRYHSFIVRDISVEETVRHVEGTVGLEHYMPFICFTSRDACIGEVYKRFIKSKDRASKICLCIVYHGPIIYIDRRVLASDIRKASFKS